MPWLPLLLLAPLNAPAPTFAELPAEVRAQVDLRLARRSGEIAGSPFATMTSFEVHDGSEDAGVIETMAALGVKCVVMHNIHGSLGDPDDPRLTAWLDGCAREGIEVRCILSSRDLELWRAAFTNWGSRIRDWSLLNEPNAPGAENDHGKPNVRPEEYVGLLREVHAIRDELAPGCRLWGPESAMLQCMEESPWPWMRLAREEGLLGLLDGITVHPYRQGYSPANTPEKPSTFEGRPGLGYDSYEGQIATLRTLTRQMPLAVTEVGWSTTPEGTISEATQAKFALRQQIQDFALGIRPAVWFLLRERHVDRPFAAGHIENHFGIVHDDNTPKPAYRALQSLYAQIDDTCLRSLAPVRFEAPEVRAYLFDDYSGAVPARKLLYWQPVAARDDCPVAQVAVEVDGVRIAALPLSDTPRLLRLHRVEGQWGWPAVVDLVGQTVETSLAWEMAGGE